MRAVVGLALLSAAHADWLASNTYPIWNLGCWLTPMWGDVQGRLNDGCFGTGSGQSARWTCDAAARRATEYAYAQPNCTGAANVSAAANTSTCAPDAGALNLTLTGQACGTGAWPLPAPQTWLTDSWDTTSSACPLPAGSAVQSTSYTSLPVPCLSLPFESRGKLARALAGSSTGTGNGTGSGSVRGGAAMPIPVSFNIPGCNADGSVTTYLYTQPQCAAGSGIPATYGPGSCISGGGFQAMTNICVGGNLTRPAREEAREWDAASFVAVTEVIREALQAEYARARE